MIPATRRFILRGDCMLPAVEPGDEVWVRPGTAPRPGGLVAYARFTGAAPEIAVHRLLASGATRADARLACDRPEERAAVVGAVAAVRRGGRLVLLDTPRGRALSAFSRAYGRAVMAFLRERVIVPLAESGRPRSAGALRAAALALPRAAFRLLSEPAS